MKTLNAALIALVLAASGNAMAATKTVKLTIDGMVCAFCAQGIEKRLRAQAATDDVFVSLENKIVAVGLKEGQDISDAQLRKELTEAGYQVREIKRSDEPLSAVRKAKK